MLSRLKRRTASTSLHDAPTVPVDDPPSPTMSRRTSTSTSTSANNTPAKQSVHSNRTLSPTRTRASVAPPMSRSSSYGSVELEPHSHPDYAAARVGQGSLSLDHLSPQDGSARLTLVVQAPELIDQDALAAATPMPSRPLELRAMTEDPSLVVAQLHSATPMSRPRAYTTSEALRSSRSLSPAPPVSQSSSTQTVVPTESGLDALAQINSPPTSTSNEYLHATRPHSNSVPTSPPSHSRPHSRSVSRPASRSPSFNSQTHARPDSSTLRPPAATSVSPTRSRRGTKSSGSSSTNGIAGAIALSGVALASPSSQLRHPLGLARAGSHAPPPLNSSSSASLSSTTTPQPPPPQTIPNPSPDSSQAVPPHSAPPTSNQFTSTDSISVANGGTGMGPGSPALSTTATSGDSHSYLTGGGGGRRSTASSIHQGVLTPVRSRESIDSTSMPMSSPPDSRRESQVYYDHHLGGGAELDHHAFLSMDQLGDFDDVVSQLGTGYAVASSKRNSDFHALFKSISDDDYLIEDYGCALQREILIQGRLYISEHHLSFYANIFGWVTSLTIPFAEVCSIEKRMTAYVIPNAIQISTMHARHTFASFLSRDTTYDLIGNIWRMVHPVIPTSAGLPDHHHHHHQHSPHASDDEGEQRGGGGGGAAASVNGDDAGLASGVDKESASGGREGRGMRKRLKGFRRPRGGTGESSNAGGSKTVTDSLSKSARGGEAGGGRVAEGGGGGGSGNNSVRPGTPNNNNKGGDKRHVHAVTHDTCPTLKNLKEVCMDTTFPSAPEKIYNLMFTSGFMKDFWTENQKLLDLQIGDWAPQATGSNLLARSFSYIKPLNGSIGPKQTKCLITDESAHVDFDDFVCVVTTTRTPDVPSGSAFAVKTRTSMTWAKGNSCRVVVTTGVEWSKSSFIKGIIEKSCIDGQKTYHTDLEKAMRSYITTHRNEFVEEGHADDADDEEDDEEDDDAESGSPALGGSAGHRGDGDDPSSSSLRGSGERDASSRTWTTSVLEALEPILDVVSEQSPKTLVVAVVLFVLVVSNLWTLSSGRRQDASVHPNERARARTAGSIARRSDQVDSRSPDEVASAVRDVLQDYFKQQVKQDPLSTELSDSPTPWRDDVDEIGKVLDQLEARIQNLRTRLLSEVD